MSEQKPPGAAPEAPASKSAAMIAALVGVAMISGLLIVTAFQVTLPAIKANKAEALRKALFEVIPGAARTVTFKLEDDGSVTRLVGEDDDAVKFYAGYDAGGELAGIAVEARGQGYQDFIRILYGYSPERQELIGMKVLESKETPGLGDKIGKDPKFLANFKDLDVTLAPGEGSGLRNAIQVVKKGKKRERWQIDGITGATISSKAIGKMLNKNLPQRLPRVRNNLSLFEGAP